MTGDTAGARPRRWPWVAAAVTVLIILPVALIGIPILTHTPAGVSGQNPSTDAWPLEVTANGADGRERSLSLEANENLDTSALSPGDRLIVRGAGYDAARGIYVAICVIPQSPGG